LRDCFFEEVCSGSIDCDTCRSNGLHYLASRVYIPKTNIPLRYLSTKLADLDLSGDRSTINKYFSMLGELVDRGEGLYIYGAQPGTGKTSVCCVLLIHYLFFSLRIDPYNVDNRRVLYINIPEFLERIKKSFEGEDPDLEGLLAELTDLYRAPKLILFDDIGAEKPSDWVRERLYSLINFRVSNNLANLYTSNLASSELISRVGARIVSRIEGHSKPVELRGPDKRRLSW
jgi:DNA replication protein DnaC